MKNNLPLNWCFAKLKDICVIIPGTGFPKKLQGNLEGKYPFFKVGDISKNIQSGHRYLKLCDNFVNEEQVQETKGKLLPPNSIVFAKIGEALKLNRRGIITCPSLIDNNLVGIKSLNNIVINDLYLFLFFKTIRLEKYSRSTTVPSVRKSDIEQIDIPLPPLNEQQRIVNKIEELFSELDAGVESLKTAQAQLKRYRQSVLKSAFEGKLTAEWREQQQEEGNLESAEELLQKIQEERQNRYQKELEAWKKEVELWEENGKLGKKPKKPQKPKELSPLTEAELAELSSIPKDWVFQRLGNISKKIKIGPFGSLLHKSDYVYGQIPIVNPSHIKQGKIVTDNNFTITQNKWEELSSYALAKEDIVFARRGEMGRCAVVTENENGFLCGTGSLLIRLSSICSSKFYYLILSSQTTINYFKTMSIGTTMRNLNENILNQVPVPLCSLKEQNKIVEEIESRFSICDQLEATITENLQKSEALRQSILKQAFSGKLVPQDPNDEPASVLLERIKQEKENAQNLTQTSLNV